MRRFPRPSPKMFYSSSDEEDEKDQENQVPAAAEDLLNTVPPPIEPYRPEPKYTMDTIVTPNTIIPTCYFEILSIQYDAHEQAHYYEIKSLPQMGEQLQPNITRTVIEGRLKSFEEMSRLHGHVDSSDGLSELSDSTNMTVVNTSRKIEVGDEVSVRINSTDDKDKSAWVLGTVVGLHGQYGLWECFLVSVDKSDQLMPCTERLLRLIMKGTQIKKKSKWGAARGNGPSDGRVRTLKPVHQRSASGYLGPEKFITQVESALAMPESWVEPSG